MISRNKAVSPIPDSFPYEILGDETWAHIPLRVKFIKCVEAIVNRLTTL